MPLWPQHKHHTLQTLAQHTAITQYRTVWCPTLHANTCFEHINMQIPLPCSQSTPRARFGWTFRKTEQEQFWISKVPYLCHCCGKVASIVRESFRCHPLFIGSSNTVSCSKWNGVLEFIGNKWGNLLDCYQPQFHPIPPTEFFYVAAVFGKDSNCAKLFQCIL